MDSSSARDSIRAGSRTTSVCLRAKGVLRHCVRSGATCLPIRNVSIRTTWPPSFPSATGCRSATGRRFSSSRSLVGAMNNTLSSRLLLAAVLWWGIALSLCVHAQDDELQEAARLGDQAAELFG